MSDDAKAPLDKGLLMFQPPARECHAVAADSA